MNGYFYFEPQGGFNDILCNIKFCLDYCERHKRICLVNGKKTTYNINFSDYFDISLNNIIIDTKEIEQICNNQHTVYPNELQDKLKDLLNGKIKLQYTGKGIFWYNGKSFELTENIQESMIVYSCWGGGCGYPLFKHIIFKENVIYQFNERYKQMCRPYLGIQIRNTDYSCDYINFFNSNKDIINTYKDIYLATDDINLLSFFKEHNIEIKNFTRFPKTPYVNLHSSQLDPDIKFIDMICDIILLSLSFELISPSKGGFIKLIKTLKESNMFEEFN
jgi:hypothetical protein